MILMALGVWESGEAEGGGADVRFRSTSRRMRSRQRLRRTVHVSRRSKERCVGDGLVDPGVLERRIQAKVSPIPCSWKKAKKGFLPGMVDAAAGGDIGPLEDIG